jgi:hypothetical protein
MLGLQQGSRLGRLPVRLRLQAIAIHHRTAPRRPITLSPGSIQGKTAWRMIAARTAGTVKVRHDPRGPNPESRPAIAEGQGADVIRT